MFALMLAFTLRTSRSEPRLPFFLHASFNVPFHTVGLNPEERLLEATMCLAAVCARAAPKPFGKGIEQVFAITWSAMIELLKHTSVDKLTAAFN